MQNETMSKRIRTVRKTLDLTQQEFADRLGISRGNIATYETRDGSPSNSVINLICREFNVNETWLRTGEGEMFIKTPNTALEELAADFYLDPFDEALVDEYLHLTPNNRKAVRTFFYRVLKKSVGDKKPEELLKTEMDFQTLEEVASLVNEAKRTQADTTGQAWTGADLAAKVAELERQNRELAAKMAAMEEEDARMEAAEELPPAAM